MNRRNLPATALVASNVPSFWVDVCETLDNAGDIEVAACAAEVGEALRVARVAHPDLAVLDLRFPWDTVCLLTSRFHQFSIPALLVGDGMSGSDALNLLRMGACGMVDRTAPPSMLLECMRAVAAGDVWICRQLQQEILTVIHGSESDVPGAPGPASQKNGTGSEPDPPDDPAYDDSFRLTRRELEVLAAVIEGHTNREIAGFLGITVWTVKHHLSRIFRKSGVRNRTELVRFSWDRESGVRARSA